MVVILHAGNSASLWPNGALGGEMKWARFSCTRQKRTLNENKAGRLHLLSGLYPLYLRAGIILYMVIQNYALLYEEMTTGKTVNSSLVETT